MSQCKNYISYYAYAVFFNWYYSNDCPWEAELNEFIKRVKKAGYEITDQFNDLLTISW